MVSADTSSTFVQSMPRSDEQAHLYPWKRAGSLLAHRRAGRLLACGDIRIFHLPYSFKYMTICFSPKKVRQVRQGFKTLVNTRLLAVSLPVSLSSHFWKVRQQLV